MDKDFSPLARDNVVGRDGRSVKGGEEWNLWTDRVSFSFEDGGGSS